MKKILLVLAIFSAQCAFAQPSLRILAAKQTAQRQNGLTPSYKLTLTAPTQGAIFFAKDALLRQDDAPTWLANQLEMRTGIDQLTVADLPAITPDNLSVQKLQQFYKGIKVEHGVVKTTGNNGLTAMMQLEFYSIPDAFNTTPTLSQNQALASATKLRGDKHYFWLDSLGAVVPSLLPPSSLVIVSTYKNDSSVCLAYKFRMDANNPFSSAEVYVNAWDGSLVLVNDLVETQNVTGMADTKYNGRQAIVTDDGTKDPLKPYRLLENRNGYQLEIRNMRNKELKPATGAPFGIGFTDNDNNWTAAEYDNNTKDNAALDAKFNLQIISDYWNDVHGRHSWDNNYGAITCFAHGVFTDDHPMDNAFWWAGCNCLQMGDGTSSTSLPRTAIDVMAHEIGHGICQATADLVYRWESGAMNEAFSDIWGACLTNYVKIHYPTIGGSKITYVEGDETSNPGAAKPGIRNMAKPEEFNDPNTYGDKAHFWKDGDYASCPIEDNDLNDHCGVHTNSGVLNKWFYLITEGETDVNSKNIAYSIKGLGFGITQKIAYLTLLNLTPNASYSVARIVSTYAATALYGEGSDTVKTIKAAWVAVGVDSNIYDMSNTPVFTTNNFTSIDIATDSTVWAGTNYAGIYKYSGSTWTKSTAITNVRINSIKADRKGGIWVAQSGTQTNASQAIAGGVNYFANNTASTQFFTNSTQNQIPSRNARCIYIDTFLTNDGTNPKVWVGMGTFLRTSDLISQSGMLGQGFFTNYKQFLPVSEGIDVAAGTRSCLSVAGTSDEVWTFVQANFGVNQLLQYDANTNALIASYDATKTPGIPSGFVVRSIVFDAYGRGWFALADGRLLVHDGSSVWHLISLPSLFPNGASCNFNSIASDQYGGVYIGTTQGLLFFDPNKESTTVIEDERCYKLYTTPHGLPSNNINAIAYDNINYRLLLATDKGIVFWQPLCYGGQCLRYPYYESAATSLTDGNWGDAAIWSTNQVPDSLTRVTLTKNIVVNVDAKCKYLKVQSPGSIHINAGKKLTIFKKPDDVIFTDEDNGKIKE